MQTPGPILATAPVLSDATTSPRHARAAAGVLTPALLEVVDRGGSRHSPEGQRVAVTVVALVAAAPSPVSERSASASSAPRRSLFTPDSVLVDARIEPRCSECSSKTSRSAGARPRHPRRAPPARALGQGARVVAARRCRSSSLATCALRGASRRAPESTRQGRRNSSALMLPRRARARVRLCCARAGRPRRRRRERGPRAAKKMPKMAQREPRGRAPRPRPAAGGRRRGDAANAAARARARSRSRPTWIAGGRRRGGRGPGRRPPPGLDLVSWAAKPTASARGDCSARVAGRRHAQDAVVELRLAARVELTRSRTCAALRSRS